MGKSSNHERTSEPVRVLHLIDRLGGGGCERWLWDIVRLSPPERVKHYVITFSPDKGQWVYAERLREKGVYHQGLKIPPLEPLPKLKTFREKTNPSLKSRFKTFLDYNLALCRVLQAIFTFRPDVIHTHTYRSFRIGLIIKVLARHPMIHSVPALFIQMTTGGRGWMLNLYARYHSLVDCFFTGASQYELRSIKIPESKILPINGVVDIQSIRTVKQDQNKYQMKIRDALGLPSGALIALSVGRLHASKGHLFACEALPSLISEIPNLHWLILGEGKQRAELEEKAKALGIARHVHLLGFQDNPLPYYAAATIFFRTVIFEAENLSSYQAIAMGLPVVGFDTGCETELIPKIGNGILVPNQDVVAFSEAVARILRLPDKGQELGSRGIKYSRDHLDIQQSISAFSRIYFHLKNIVRDKDPGS